MWYLIGGIVLPVGTDWTIKLLAAFPSIWTEIRIPINEGGEGYRLNLGHRHAPQRAGSEWPGIDPGGRKRSYHRRTGVGNGARWLILNGLVEELGRRMVSQGKLPAAILLSEGTPDFTIFPRRHYPISVCRVG